jgi:uncharacterized protein YciI
MYNSSGRYLTIRDPMINGMVGKMAQDEHKSIEHMASELIFEGVEAFLIKNGDLRVSTFSTPTGKITSYTNKKPTADEVKKAFIVILKYLADLEKVEIYQDAHYRFLRTMYKDLTLIASGEQVPNTGMILLLKAHSRQEIEDRLKEDPMLKHQIADHEIYEFEVGPSIDAFVEIFEKNK